MTPAQILGAARAGDLERLGAGRGDVSGAIRHFALQADAASAVELAGRTWRMWSSSGELEEGSAVLAAALAVSDKSPTPWRVRVLCAAGLFAFRAGDEQRSRAFNEEALLLSREINDVRGECDALTGLARIALREGRYQDVVALARQARERAEAAGDREAGAGPLHLQAAGVRLQGDHRAARELYMESLRLNTELANATWVAMEMHNLGWVELHLGDVEAARLRFLERDAASDSDAYWSAWTDLNWAAVAAAEGDAAEAGRRFAIGMRALENVRHAPDPDDQFELDWLRAQLR